MKAGPDLILTLDEALKILDDLGIKESEPSSCLCSIREWCPSCDGGN